MSAISTAESVAIQIASQCDRGKVREENQDSVRQCVTPLGDLLIVADGIGGYEGGGVASRMAVEAISASLESMPAFFPIDIAIEEAVCRANAEIVAAAAEPDTPNSRMGSTVVLALLQQDPENNQLIQAWIGHIGDSRAYRLHDRRLSRVTRDHSAVQMLLDHDLIAPEEASTHPDASVLTRALGHEPNVKIDLNSIELEPGDTLLLCSDGLWGYVSDREIERVLADPALTAEQASRALLDLALDAGGHDNVGIQLARLAASAAATRAPAPAYESPSDPELRLSVLFASQLPEPAAASAPNPETAPFAQTETAPAAALPAPVAPPLAPLTIYAAPEPEIPPASAPAPSSSPTSAAALYAVPVATPAASAGYEPEPLFPIESNLEWQVPADQLPEAQLLAPPFLGPPPASVTALSSEPAAQIPEPRMTTLLWVLASLWEMFVYPLGRDYDFAPEWHTDYTFLEEIFGVEEAKDQPSKFPTLLASFLVTCAASTKREFASLPRRDLDLPAQFKSSAPEVSTLLKYLGILLLAFCTSCGLVYCALFLNWFGIDQILHLR